MTRTQLRNRQWFWLVILVFSISTLAASVFAETGRWFYVGATVFGHIELVLLGAHLYRTRNTTPS